ncbi:MAG: cell envelope integrity protein CreD [Wenzhouxiangella sp.]
MTLFKTTGWRFFVVGALILLMGIPLIFIGLIVSDRTNYSRDARFSVGEEWGGPQHLNGPVLRIPVEQLTQVSETRNVVDPETGIQRLDAEGNPVTRIVETEVYVRRDSIHVFPDDLEILVDTKTEVRNRGIFAVPVLVINATVRFDFSFDSVESVLREHERILWERSEILMDLSTNRSLRGEARLQSDGRAFSLEPMEHQHAGRGGIFAAVEDPRIHRQFELVLDLNGAESFRVVPVGRQSRVVMTGDWPHPSFTGNFLPNQREVADDGFTAEWSIPHLARALPQVNRSYYRDLAIREASFGVDFYQPNDLYQKTYRAARYGLLFIGLTFLTVFLIKGSRPQSVHPVQYILIGLAQAVFFLLLLAFAEQIGFTKAYWLASVATIVLISGYGALALKLRKKLWFLTLMLGLLYGVLFLVIRSADYALLAGSILSFIAIAGTMYATRNEQWYSAPDADGQSPAGRRSS